MPLEGASERELVESFEEICGHYGRGDTEGAMALTTNDEDVIVVEPGPYQFWVGAEAVRHNIQLDYDTVEGDIPVRVLPRFASVNGDVGWLVGEMEVGIRYKGHSMLLQDLRLVGVARRLDGAWKWACIHVSLIDPEQRPEEVWTDRTLHERLGMRADAAESHGAQARAERKLSGTLIEREPQTFRVLVESLEELWRRYGAGDTEGAMRLMSPDDDVVLVETGTDQFWVGRDEVRRNIQLDYDSVDGDIPVRTEVYHAARHGDTAWLVGELEMSIDFKGRRLQLQDLRFTAIAKRVDDEWRWSCLQVGLLDPQKGPDDQWNTWTVHERLGGAVPAESS